MEKLALDDPRWSVLTGGYKAPYDPRKALQRLRSNGDDDEAWEELWNELHHQGDLGDASYAALVVLADVRRERPDLGWNLFALAACIEGERHRVKNPPVPDWLAAPYHEALGFLRDVALEQLRSPKDPIAARSALALAALTAGQTKLGVILSNIDESEIDELAEEQLAWSDSYAD